MGNIDINLNSYTITLINIVLEELILKSEKLDTIREIDVSVMAKRRGMSISEMQSHIDGLVEQGFIIHIGKNKYDVEPFVRLYCQFLKEHRDGKEVDIQNLVNQIIG